MRGWWDPEIKNFSLDMKEVHVYVLNDPESNISPQTLHLIQHILLLCYNQLMILKHFKSTGKIIFKC